MGLAEKRAIAEIKEQPFISFKKELEGIFGAPIEMNVKWDQLAVEEMSHLYQASIPKVFFQPLLQAFKAICADAMGKEALQAKLKRIDIQNASSIWSANSAFTFKNGILTFDHSPVHNVDEVKERTKVLTETLEKEL